MKILAENQIMQELDLNSLLALNEQILKRIGELEDNYNYLAFDQVLDLHHAQDYYKKHVAPRMEDIKSKGDAYRRITFNTLRHTSLFIF
jgi:hypothetical protein